ncbi:DMT family transporter [Caballeronia sp. DA-9]|uniref:DMT family transporter n=1 Tax=Caballeronia sp. DA-9 TaxID=3436237 RepID=UPI003F677EB6
MHGHSGGRRNPCPAPLRGNHLNRVIGVVAAVFATFSWALNFLSPYVTGHYSAYDFIGVRYVFAGVLGMVLVSTYWAEVRCLHVRELGLAFCLGTIGYVGYLACIMGGVLYAGPVITPAFIGLVPILTAVMGNAIQKTLPWIRLIAPVALAVVGLFLTNLTLFAGRGHATGASLLIGVCFSLAAILMWLVFSFYNQRAFERNPQLHSGAWTALMMTGAGVGTLLLVPLGLQLSVFNFPSLGFGWSSAGHVYMYALALTVTSSFAGAWAWNVASKRLPMVLTGQLISVQTLFATTFGLLAQHRLPAAHEIAGVLMIVASAVIAVRLVLVPLTRKSAAFVPDRSTHVD